MKLYMTRRDYWWALPEVWTVCFEYYVRKPNGEKIVYPKIIQSKREANRVVNSFINTFGRENVFIKDVAVKNENLGV